MTVSLQTLISRSVRNMGNVHPVVKEAAIETIERAYSEGITAQISDGLRTYSEQARLYSKGRTAPGNIVTYAEPGESYHNFGLAVDFFLTSNDGQRAIWVVNSDWRRVAAIGKSLGFEWGGDWSGFVDNPHLQMTGGLSLSQLRAGQRPDLGGVTYTAPSDDGLLEKGDSGAAVEDLQETLIDLGYDLSEYGADSHFGDETKDAVKEFQADRGITVDGKVGPVTTQELKEAQKPTLPHETYWYDEKEPMFHGSGVLAVQEATSSVYFYPEKGAPNNGCDSWYGPDTADAVGRFQSYYGLKVDEVYGPKTRAKLIEVMK
ncbi:peptidoglycan-binding protein [Halobacillus ihumii]|uniref:peptidoglycan-binding protein n=1 Tax=Halobacillus ihumii TaxID=2686092 RepID=UPI0013D7473F|nr:peptidoglycan-binding protein [Halobacillus ihumii]